MLRWGCQALFASWMLWGTQAEDAAEEASQKGLWSLSPVVAPVIPQGGDSFHHPIDRFLSEHRQELGLEAVGSADKLRSYAAFIWTWWDLPPHRLTGQARRPIARRLRKSRPPITGE